MRFESLVPGREFTPCTEANFIKFIKLKNEVSSAVDELYQQASQTAISGTPDLLTGYIREACERVLSIETHPDQRPLWKLPGFTYVINNL